MERIMSVEDKIKKAEEIYYKRKNLETPVKEKTRSNKKPKKDIKIFRKMIKQIIMCIIIYIIFYLIINSNSIFSQDFTEKAREILSQDINFSQIYSIVTNKINEIIKNYINTENVVNNEENVQINEEKTKEEIQNNDQNIGGAEELSTNDVENVENNSEIIETDETSSLSQMEQDANYIKSTISFIKPVTGTISSMFGPRNPTTASVPKNHTGTDIAATIGTKIVSATEGNVILVSSQGDYGNHLKIQINDVTILYAHCDKVYVKEGDTVLQGQEIGEVGNTGNTTGPHLHFEIMYQNRYVDPQLILEL